MSYSQEFIDAAWQKTLSALQNNPHITSRQKGYLSNIKIIDVTEQDIIFKVIGKAEKEFFQNQIKEIFNAAIIEGFEAEKEFNFLIDPKENYSGNRQGTFDFDDEDDIFSSRSSSDLKPKNSQNKKTKTVKKNKSKKKDKFFDGTINPKFNFETFVRGQSNRFAHATAMSVAEGPAQSFNPLFIYGDSGLGKTHLLHAIGNYAQQIHDDIYVHYVTAEEFTNDFINSIKDGTIQEFKTTYRQVDILLIDDIQFLGEKDRTIEEFFHTFNSLHNLGKQIVIASDVAPKKLQGITERIRTRLEWGLITDIQPPELETRIAILLKKSQTNNISISDEVLQYIASKITSNIRELEGALTRVTAYASLNKKVPDIESAEYVLKDLIPEDDSIEITSEIILEETGEYFNLSQEDLVSSSRSRPLATARQIAMYLCRELTSLSLPAIGNIFGGRDHTTVIHADKKVREMLQENHEIYTQVSELTNQIKNHQRAQQ